jgi:hypothetical protein
VQQGDEPVDVELLEGVDVAVQQRALVLAARAAARC